MASPDPGPDGSSSLHSPRELQGADSDWTRPPPLPPGALLQPLSAFAAAAVCGCAAGAAGGDAVVQSIVLGVSGAGLLGAAAVRSAQLLFLRRQMLCSRRETPSGASAGLSRPPLGVAALQGACATGAAVAAVAAFGVSACSALPVLLVAAAAALYARVLAAAVVVAALGCVVTVYAAVDPSPPVAYPQWLAAASFWALGCCGLAWLPAAGGGAPARVAKAAPSPPRPVFGNSGSAPSAGATGASSSDPYSHSLSAARWSGRSRAHSAPTAEELRRSIQILDCRAIGVDVQDRPLPSPVAAQQGARAWPPMREFCGVRPNARGAAGLMLCSSCRIRAAAHMFDVFSAKRARSTEAAAGNSSGSADCPAPSDITTIPLLENKCGAGEAHSHATGRPSGVELSGDSAHAPCSAARHSKELAAAPAPATPPAAAPEAPAAPLPPAAAHAAASGEDHARPPPVTPVLDPQNPVQQQQPDQVERLPGRKNAADTAGAQAADTARTQAARTNLAKGLQPLQVPANASSFRSEASRNSPQQSPSGSLPDGRRLRVQVNEPTRSPRGGSYSPSHSAAGSPRSKGKYPQSPAPRRQPLPGRAVTWKKGALLGQGAFGTVHVGLNCATGEMMAVKNIVFNAKAPNLKQMLTKLQNEITLMKSLEHENIVRYYFTERAGDSINIFMEYVPGGSVADLIQQFGALSVDTACFYAHQILLGLRYLHSKEVIHRDIKGANILLTVDGKCKLGDFGASAMVSNINPRRKSLTGTPLWMAPEVITQQEYNWSVDIWSLGCTVLEMVTGDAPFAHLQKSQLEVLHWICDEEEDMDLPESLCTPENEQLRDFVVACLQREPKDRPLADALLGQAWVLEAQEEDMWDAYSEVVSQGPRSPRDNRGVHGTLEVFLSEMSTGLRRMYYNKWGLWYTIRLKQRTRRQRDRNDKVATLMLSMSNSGVMLIYFKRLQLNCQERKRKRVEDMYRQAIQQRAAATDAKRKAGPPPGHPMATPEHTTQSLRSDGSDSTAQESAGGQQVGNSSFALQRHRPSFNSFAFKRGNLAPAGGGSSMFKRKSVHAGHKQPLQTPPPPDMTPAERPWVDPTAPRAGGVLGMPSNDPGQPMQGAHALRRVSRAVNMANMQAFLMEKALPGLNMTNAAEGDDVQQCVVQDEMLADEAASTTAADRPRSDSGQAAVAETNDPFQPMPLRASSGNKISKEERSQIIDRRWSIPNICTGSEGSSAAVEESEHFARQVPAPATLE